MQPAFIFSPHWQMFWARPSWLFLHTVAATYPEKPTSQDRVKYGQFFKTVGDVLPCPRCREGWKESLAVHDINKYLDDPMQLSYFMYLMHKDVNDTLERPSPEFKNVWKRFRSGDYVCGRLATIKVAVAGAVAGAVAAALITWLIKGRH